MVGGGSCGDGSRGGLGCRRWKGGVACIFKKKKRGKKEKSEEKTEVVAGEDGGNGGATRHRLRLKKDSICQ